MSIPAHAQAIYDEMIRELLARRTVAQRTIEELHKCPATIEQLQARITVINEELKAYGYIERTLPGG